MNIEIRKFRERSNISQKSLADELNVDQSTVAKWETEKAFPRAELLPKLADVLGCTIDELYGRGKCERGGDTSSTNLMVGPPSPAGEG